MRCISAFDGKTDGRPMWIVSQQGANGDGRILGYVGAGREEEMRSFELEKEHLPWQADTESRH